jgi:hypothetical protein
MTCLCQPADVDDIESFVGEIYRQPSRLIESPHNLDKGLLVTVKGQYIGYW